MILLISRQGSEQVVQLLAQMAFDGAQLGVPDRNPLGPIVRDRDRPAILDGARAGRRALRWRLHIVVPLVETVRPAARRAATTFARQGDRKSVGSGKGGSVRVDLGGRRVLK